MKNLLFIACLYCLSISAFSFSPPNEKFAQQKASPELHSSAAAIEDYLNAGDLNYFLENFAIDTFIERIGETFLSRFSEAEKETLVNGPSMPALLNPIRKVMPARFDENFSGIDSWHFVSHRSHKKQNTLLYRVELGNYIDYIEFAVENQQNRWRIIDTYTHSREVWLSEMIGHVSRMLVEAHMTGSAPNPLIAAAQTPGSDIIELFKRLDPEDKQNHILQALLLGQAAMRNSPELYSRAVQQIIPFTQDEQFSLARYAFYSESANYPSALAAVRHFNKRIGGDSQARLIEAEILNNIGDKKQSRKVLAKTLKQYPEEALVYYTALVLLAKQQQYREATLVLDVLKDDFDTTMNAELLSEFGEMENFIASQEFKNWQSGI